MMISPRLHNPENVTRLRYARIGVTILCAALSAFLIITAVLSLRNVWSAESALKEGKSRVFQLTRNLNDMKLQEARRSHARSMGLDSFAVTFSGWARAQGVSVQSIVPEGAPSSSKVTFESADLGEWTACKVRVKGDAEFAKFMNLVEKFRDPEMPVQLESFGLQSTGSGRGSVSFDLLLTVYEKKGMAG